MRKKANKLKGKNDKKCNNFKHMASTGFEPSLFELPYVKWRLDQCATQPLNTCFAKIIILKAYLPTVGKVA